MATKRRKSLSNGIKGSGSSKRRDVASGRFDVETRKGQRGAGKPTFSLNREEIPNRPMSVVTFATLDSLPVFPNMRSAKQGRMFTHTQLVIPVPRADSSFYPKEIFDNQAEYDASVDSVVARIKSGAVKARTPDE